MPYLVVGYVFDDEKCSEIKLNPAKPDRWISDRVGNPGTKPLHIVNGVTAWVGKRSTEGRLPNQLATAVVEAVVRAAVSGDYFATDDEP